MVLMLLDILCAYVYLPSFLAEPGQYVLPHDWVELSTTRLFVELPILQHVMRSLFSPLGDVITKQTSRLSKCYA